MKLYEHQKKILEQNPKKSLLAWEVGSGKSLAGIKLCEQNMEDNDIGLVICPKSLKDKWSKDDLDKYAKSPNSWVVISKEEFKKQVPLLQTHKQIIVDEAHFFSGMRSFRDKSQMLKALLFYIKLHKPKNIYLLTGTPYLSSPYNIYALAEILGHKWDFKRFKEHFFHQVNMGGRFPVPVIKKNIEGDIAKLVAQIGDVVKMEDCIDVPEQVYQAEYFELTASQKQAMSEITETLPIVKWTKAHQICGGSLKSDGYIADQFFPCEKIARLKELVSENKKAVVVCRYNNEINMLTKELSKIKPVYQITGSTKDRHGTVKLAEQEDDCVVLANSACSEGYELASFRLMVFYSYDFSLKNTIQIQGRIRRINNLKKNVYLSLVVKDSIDEDVYKSMLAKKSFDIEIYDKRKRLP